MTLRMTRNPARNQTKIERVENTIARHGEAIVLVTGIVLGFVLGKL